MEFVGSRFRGRTEETGEKYVTSRELERRSWGLKVTYVRREAACL
jgi:hypothetical protein